MTVEDFTLGVDSMRVPPGENGSEMEARRHPLKHHPGITLHHGHREPSAGMDLKTCDWQPDSDLTQSYGPSLTHIMHPVGIPLSLLAGWER